MPKGLDPQGPNTTAAPPPLCPSQFFFLKLLLPCHSHAQSFTGSPCPVRSPCPLARQLRSWRGKQPRSLPSSPTGNHLTPAKRKSQLRYHQTVPLFIERGPPFSLLTPTKLAKCPPAGPSVCGKEHEETEG